MTNRADIPLSGLRAAFLKQAASAHNAANLGTDGAARLRTTAVEAPSGGVRVRTDTVALSAEDRSATERLAGVQNPIDAVEEGVARIESRAGAGANLRVLRVVDRMAGSLFDTLG